MFRSSSPAATSPRVPHEPLLERGPHHGRYLVVFHGLKAEVVANTQLRGRTARSVLTRELRLPGAVAATSVDVQKYKRLRAVEVALCDTPPQHADRCGPKLRRREPRSSRARRGPLRARGLWRSCSSLRPTLIACAARRSSSGSSRRPSPRSERTSTSCWATMLSSRFTLLRLGETEPGVGVRVEDLLFHDVP